MSFGSLGPISFGPGYGLGYDLSSALDIAAGAPAGMPTIVERADPTKEYVAAAGLVEMDRGFLGIEGGFGGPFAWHGVAEYERMYHTPAVGSSFNALRAGVLANGVNLLPAIKPKTGSPRPGQQDGTGIDADIAAQLCESNKRLLDMWETPVDEVLWEMMEDMYLGHVMAEIVSSDIAGGPDKGLLGIRQVKPKPRSTYQFRVDRGFNVLGLRVLCYDPGNASAEMKLFEGDALKHFTWSTWDSYRGDPRGRSCFRMAHYHWRLLMDLWPEVWKGWQQFGVPMLSGTTAPDARMVAVTGKDGKPVAGSGVTAEYAMAMNGQRMRNGSVTAGPNGSEWKVLESTKDSSVAATGIAVLEGQIKSAILLQTRATTEAKHGSKADSETGQDIMGTIVRFVRKTRERWLRRLLIRQNEWNYGPDIARRLTPLVDLGGTEHQDFAANSAGVATLFQSSYFTEEQLAETDTFLGFNPRRPGDKRVGPNGVIDIQPVGDQAALGPPSPDAGQATQNPAPAEGAAP